MIELDHVLIAVTDLDAAGREFEARHGLASVAGGRHPGWGTANRIVPLGDTYLELVAAVDTAEAAGSPFGRWVAAAPSGRPLGWAVRTQGLDVIAGRLGLAVTTGSRRREDGQVLRWRLAGMEQAVADAALPFFIEWGDGTPLPGRAEANHRDGPCGSSRSSWQATPPAWRAGWERITSPSPCRRGRPQSPASCWLERAAASPSPAPRGA